MTEPVFGGYGHQTIDRTEEDDQIRRQPPANFGNPGKTSVLAQLTEKFAGYDDQHVKVLNAYTKNGARVWLEFDIDVTEDDLREYRKEGLNRAARRAKGEPEAVDVRKAPIAARTLSDRNARVWFEDPEAGGEHLEVEGRALTVHSDEWLESIGQEDPVQGLRELFGDVKTLVLYQDFIDAAGHIGDPEGVDPTRGASGD